MKKQSVNFLKDEKSYLCTVEQIKRKESVAKIVETPLMKQYFDIKAKHP